MVVDKAHILNEIKETLRSVMPDGGHALLFGSQARGDARSGSDWDILILLDKSKIEGEDFDNVSYPLRELGWKLNECINPVMYTLKEWMKYKFSPFYKSVTKDGIVLL